MRCDWHVMYRVGYKPTMAYETGTRRRMQGCPKKPFGAVSKETTKTCKCPMTDLKEALAEFVS